jgi:hypothetical protein
MLLDEADHALLELFADRVVLAMDALSHFKEKSREFEDVRSTFKSILDAKRYIDTQNVDAMSNVLREVSDKLGMSPEENATLRYVFNVYDLGLAKIGNNIIKQPRELTNQDRFDVEQHTIVGMDMLKPIEREVLQKHLMGGLLVIESESTERTLDIGPTFHARPATSPVWVFTRTSSPSLMKSGTRACSPVSSVASLVAPPAAVSPRRPNSVETTVSSTYCGSCNETGAPLYFRT